MAFKSIKEIIKDDPRWAKFNPDKLNSKEIKTQTFGWVKISDYNNPRYGFLRRDRGVPTIKQDEIRIVDPIYTEWRENKVINKIQQDKEALDSLEHWF